MILTKSSIRSIHFNSPSFKAPARTPVARPVRLDSAHSSFTAAPTAGDANAAALLGLKRGATGAPGAIKQLQDDLVGMGYLDKAVTSNGGYGKNFGPLTEAAVKRLQVDSGIPVTGQIDAATVRALGPKVPPPVLTPPPPPSSTTSGETVKNAKLNEYLLAHPEIKTVQNLVNATYPKGTYESTCRELGLDPNELLKYRTANLKDWAVTPAPPDGSMPRTTAEANQVFLNQYTTAFNPYYGKDGVSNNCGPTSLAMCLKLQDKMPPGLNTEQQIDYARGLMYPNIAGTTVKDANGNDVRLLDQDRMLTNITAVGSATGSTHQTGWASFDAALDSGKPLVVEGNISGSWRTVFSTHQGDAPGTYAGGGDGHFIAVLGKTADGKYLVADPMYAGGTVAMTRAELAVFFAKQGGDPSFTAP